MKGHMRLVRDWAQWYYDVGLNPLPSCGSRKHPALRRFARFWDHDIPSDWPRRWWAPNIQIVLGTQWRIYPLCVLDLDGPEAVIDEWTSWPMAPRTWESAAPAICPGGTKDYSVSRHLWFQLPSDLERFPTITLWQPDPKKGHPQIRMLGDRSLVVAPPSIHGARRAPYEWLIGPDQLDEPAMIPDWLLERCLSRRHACHAPRSRPVATPASFGFPSGPTRLARHYQRDEVLYALGDHKHEIAAAYGLEVSQHPNLVGFYSCRAPDRDDHDWSCTIDPRTGVLTDFGCDPVRKIPFFSVLMVLDPITFPCYSVTVDVIGSFAFGAANGQSLNPQTSLRCGPTHRSPSDSRRPCHHRS